MGLTLGLAGAALTYGLAYRAAIRAGRAVPPDWRASSYLAGLGTLGVALLGPLDAWSALLFSAHMVQHMLLMIVSPLLIALGQPVQVLLRGLPSSPRRALLRHTLGRRPVRQAMAALVHPLTLALSVNGSLVLWHLPSLYSAALHHPLIHELEHISFFVSALLFWWALVGPELPRADRLSTTAALLLVFTTWMVGDLLGATLTLSSTLLYPDYATVSAEGVAPLADQRLGGLAMWVGGGIFYAVVLVGLLVAPYLWPPGNRRAAPVRGRPSRRSAPGRDRQALALTATEQNP